jgi:mRNA interferase HigB
VRIIAIRTLREFWDIHPDAEQHLKAWVGEARAAVWRTPHDVKQHYGNASIIGNRRIVFNIKGNHYRLIVACAFRFGALYVKFVGTHAQYEAIDPETVEMQE